MTGKIETFKLTIDINAQKHAHCETLCWYCFFGLRWGDHPCVYLLQLVQTASCASLGSCSQLKYSSWFVLLFSTQLFCRRQIIHNSVPVNGKNLIKWVASTSCAIPKSFHVGNLAVYVTTAYLLIPFKHMKNNSVVLTFIPKIKKQRVDTRKHWEMGVVKPDFKLKSGGTYSDLLSSRYKPFWLSLAG